MRARPRNDRRRGPLHIVNHHLVAAADGEPRGVRRKRHRQDRVIRCRRRRERHLAQGRRRIHQRRRIPLRAVFDPGVQGGDLRRGKLFLRRHVRIGAGLQRFDQRAVLRVPFDDHLAVFSAMQKRVARGHHQPALFLLIVMAGKTIVLQKAHRFGVGVRTGGPASGHGPAWRPQKRGRERQ